MDSQEKLRTQIMESAGNVYYTYSAHWNIANCLQGCYSFMKIIQMILTAITTVGLIAEISQNTNWLKICSAGALFLNLYMLNFNIPDKIKAHTSAANDLWEVREGYKSLLVDFNDMSLEAIRAKRDKLTESVSMINKKYPGTDNKSFKKAQSDISKYTYSDGEAAKLLHMDSKL